MNNQSDSNSSALASAKQFELLTDKWIVPVEMAIGLILQMVNLITLHGQRIKGLAYTMYLKALSITYLLTIPFMVPYHIRKVRGMNVTSYAEVFYFAYLAQYLVNLWIFSGNLIIVALAVEPLRAIMFPMKTLVASPRRSLLVLFLIYLLVASVLLPVTMMKSVEMEENSNPPRYRVKIHVQDDGDWKKTVRHVLTAVFEVSLILLVLLVYACLLLKYKLIVRAHKRSVVEHQQSAAATLSSSQRRATVMCLTSVTAFLVCNSISAIKETWDLASYVTGTLQQFENSPFRLYLQCVGNIFLIFNFTLNFLLQCAFSFQYRHQLRRIFDFRKNKEPIGRDMSTRTTAAGTSLHHRSAANRKTSNV